MSTTGQPIEYSDLVKQGTFEKFAHDADLVTEHFKLLEAGIQNIAKTLGTTFNKPIVTVNDLNKVTTDINKTNAAYTAQINILQEKERIEKRILDYKSVLKKAHKEEADALKKTQAEQKKSNALSKEEIQIAKLNETVAKTKIGSYNNLSAKLSLVAIQWKKLSAEERENTKEGKLLTQQKAILTNQLTKLDAKTGVYSRNVGNYTGAIIKLQKGLGGLTGLIGTFGELLGFNTEVMENLIQTSHELIKTSKELHHVTELNEVAETARGKALTESTDVEELHNAAMAESVALTEENAIATEVYAGWTQAEVDAQIEAIAAQEALNAAQMATPWGLIIGGVVALTAVVSYLVFAYKKEKDAEEIRSKAADGTIIKNKEVRDSYNDLLQKIRDYATDLRVAQGLETKFAGEINKTKDSSVEKLREAQQDYNAALADSHGLIKDIVASGIHANDIQTEAQAKAIGVEKEWIALKKAELENEKTNADIIQKVHLKNIENDKRNQVDIQTIYVDSLKTQEVATENSGKNIIFIKRQIADAEYQLNLLKLKQTAEDEIDYSNKSLILAQEYNAQLLSIDREYAQQRKKAIDEINQLKIDGMKDGFEKDLDTLKESERKEREVILYNTDLTETERAEELRLLKEKNFQDELTLINKHQADILQIQKDGQKEQLANTVEFYDNLIKEDQDNSTYKIALLEANEKTEELKLKEQLDNKLISQEEYNKQVIKLQSDLAQAKLDETLAEDAAEKTRLENKLNDISALPNSPEKDKAAQKVLEELDALEKKTNLDSINGSNEVTDKKLSNLKLISDAQKKIYEDELTQLSDFNKAVEKGLDDRHQQEIAASNARISLIDSETNTQATLFSQGLENNLDAEKALRAKATEQQLAEARKAAKEKKGIELAETYISFVQSYLKAGKDAKTATVEALAETEIVASVESAISGKFKDGVEDFRGKGTSTSDENIVAISDHESVATAQATLETKGLISSINKNGFDGAVDWAMKNIYTPNFAASLVHDAIGENGNADYSLMLSLNTTIEKSIEKGFKKIKITNWEKNALNKLVQREIQNGIEDVYIHQDRIC